MTTNNSSKQTPPWHNPTHSPVAKCTRTWPDGSHRCPNDAARDGRCKQHTPTEG